MKVRVAPLWGPCALILVGSLACDVEESEPRTVALERVEAALSAELCDRMFSCRCEQGRRYDDRTSCEQDAALLAERIESIPDLYPELDLTYDATCMGTIVDLYASVGCSPTVPLEDPDVCTRPCHYFHGSRQVRQTCQLNDNGVSDCAQGLSCWDGACRDQCAEDDVDSFAQQGESCFPQGCAPDLLCDFNTETCQRAPQLGEPCPEGTCAGDLQCNPDNTLCETLPLAGEPCLGGFACAEDLFCEPMDPNDPMFVPRCFGPQKLAASCRGHAQCESGYCPVGFCETKPRSGEACLADICADGLDCVDAVCQAADAAICWAGLPYG